METHLATETHVTKTSHVQDVHYGESQSNNIVETAENSGGQYNNKSDAVNIQDAQSSTTTEVPTKMVQENMAAKGTPMGSQEEMEKASSTQETYLQTVKSDVINVDVVNINRKDVIVENDVNVQAISDNTVTTAGPAVTSISSNLVAEFMGRDDVDGQRYQSICWEPGWQNRDAGERSGRWEWHPEQHQCADDETSSRFLHTLPGVSGRTRFWLLFIALFTLTNTIAITALFQ